MSEETSTVVEELEGVLRRLQEGLEALMEAIGEAAPDEFEGHRQGGGSVQRILERIENKLDRLK